MLSVGQRVVCVNDCIEGATTWYRTQLLPKRGMIYTIRVIVPCRARGLDEDDCTSSRS